MHLLFQRLPLLECALELSAGLLLDLLVEGLGFCGLQVLPLLLELFFLILLSLTKLQLEVSLMEDVAEHQLRVECLDLVKRSILLLLCLLEDLISLMSLNLELGLIQGPLVHFLLFQTFQQLVSPSLEVIFRGAIPIRHS